MARSISSFTLTCRFGEGKCALAIFNIGACRLEVHMRYDLGRVYIRSVDTHEDYDRRNKRRKK